jgi:hypothetical protein
VTLFPVPKPHRKPRAPKRLTNKRNPKRRHSRFERAYHSAPFCALVKWKGCVVRGCWYTPVDVCHRVSRAAGGTWQDCFGGCREHHTESHTIGLRRFEAKYHLDLEAECAANVMEWRTMTKDQG